MTLQTTKIKNDSDCPSTPYTALWSRAFNDIRESMVDALKEIESSMVGLPWDENVNDVSMDRRDGEPKIGLTLKNEYFETVGSFWTPFDKFLDEVESDYSCGNDGWGCDMIEDLELLKAKIQERIDRMHAAIAKEDSLFNAERIPGGTEQLNQPEKPTP